ncbi:pyrroline-5-carboxylate reductase [Vibrio sp. Vb2880]|uniref:Pyrroline-5-carboxylate reductase n=4 Tax=Vibrio TaxID=662 RepID=A0A0Q2XQQ2_VIBFU|nr:MULTISPECIES: pyrroline-5-carboxylate reductase [Vibrio]EEX42760.1 pyrroline-5-carboxylate reductase [Vibrio furnissii CIP 102972]KQH83588.1 pyrroline-5-carboxylate reductase [Vibrio furnissii]MBO0215930.1 pyrroline-5-carboxylate reductase [Vibrio sp. Vb2880]MCG6215593.1 pyrroline-5-carboxylate reductase [Vibrio furnissii]MCG6232643.1 pyrroline-5-carboxylate reductase [Vibrio furnissii]
MEHRTIAFIGAGNMAHAIIAGLVGSGYPAQRIIATAPSETRRKPLEDNYGIRTTSDNLAAASEADVVVLAVKPQLMADVCQPLHAIDFSSKLVISIAAGVSVARLNAMLGSTLNLVRVMPNTPSLVNRGMAGLYAAPSVCDADKAFTAELMSAVGKVCWVEQESGINSVIAAAGSAPAYFFLFMEAMQAEAMAQGFDKDTARLLVQQSALGAAEMVQANPDIELATLREQVTSKGGTTAEAIRTFNDHQLTEIVAKAMRAAVSRAEEMEKLF